MSVCRPGFLFLQFAMEPFDVAVAFRVMIRRPPMRDAEPPERFQEARRGQPRAVVRRKRHIGRTTALGQSCEYGLLDRCQRVFGPTAM